MLREGHLLAAGGLTGSQRLKAKGGQPRSTVIHRNGGLVLIRNSSWNGTRRKR